MKESEGVLQVAPTCGIRPDESCVEEAVLTNSDAFPETASNRFLEMSYGEMAYSARPKLDLEVWKTIEFNLTHPPFFNTS